MSPDEKNAWAGEYVLGTLPETERRAFERALARDGDLAAAVRDWRAKLAPLDDVAAPVAPPPELWNRIASAARSAPRQPEPAPAPPAAPPAAGGTVVALRRRVTAWRTATIVAGALAAGFAVVAVLGPTLRQGAASGGHYVAAVTAAGAPPAMLVDVDTGAGTLSVISLAAAAPPGSSYELWYIGAGEAPRSLGVLDIVGARMVVPIAAIAGFEPAAATFAVTQEQPGGSPTGAPQGAVVFSGPLVAAPTG